MSRGSVARLSYLIQIVSLAALLFTVGANIGCGGAISQSGGRPNGDPLHLGVNPGPLGSIDPQVIELRLGSEPNNRIVSLSLTLSSLKTKNSGDQDLELLTEPVTVELARSAIVTEPVVIRTIYQDTYSNLEFPAMTGQVVFYDSGGQLTTQALNISAQTFTLSPNLVLGSSPEVLSASLDLTQTFTVGDNSVIVNPLAITASSAVPAPAVAPAIGQPETGSISFLVGTVTSVDTTNHNFSLQPASGNAMQISYDNSGGTTFVNCYPAMLTGMIAEIDGMTQPTGIVLASVVAQIGNASMSELHGVLSGYAPDLIDYNLIVEGGTGANVTTDFIGKNVTLGWLATSYSVNTTRLGLDLMANDDLMFDETTAFPGQAVEVYGDTFLITDPDYPSGYMQPRMFELEEQTITGQVFNYVYDPETQTGSFALNVPDDSMIKRMNSGLVSITVRQIPQTFLRNNPTFGNGDSVKVRGLLFADSQYSNVNYRPPASQVAFIMVADRISK